MQKPLRLIREVKHPRARLPSRRQAQRGAFPAMILSESYSVSPSCLPAGRDPARRAGLAGHAPVIDPQKMWSPSGIARGTIVHAQVGRHPGQTLAHSSIPAIAGVAFCCRGTWAEEAKPSYREEKRLCLTSSIVTASFVALASPDVSAGQLRRGRRSVTSIPTSALSAAPASPTVPRRQSALWMTRKRPAKDVAEFKFFYP